MNTTSTPTPMVIDVDPVTITNLGIIAAHLARDTRPWYTRPRTWLVIFPLVLLAVGLLVSASVTAAAVRTPPVVTVTTPPVTVAPAPVQVLPAPPAASPAPIRPTGPAPVADTPARSDAAASGIYGPGVHVVGRDIPPGDYWTSGLTQGSYGSWKRLSGLTGTTDDVLAIGTVEGPTQITILPTDKAVEFYGDAAWVAAATE
jgi:hypothetical protein